MFLCTSMYEVHSAQGSAWKNRALEQIAETFKTAKSKKKGEGPSQEQLFSQIGQLKVELDWLKKNLPCQTKIIKNNHTF